MLFNKLQKYWHTIKYQKKKQILNRLFRKFRKINSFDPKSLKLRKPKDVFNCLNLNQQSIHDKHTYNFLNDTKIIHDWNCNKYSKLWLYNLHYFNDLTSQNSDLRIEWHRELIEKWIDENPESHGTGWEPYPISIRTINWIKWNLNHNLFNEKEHRSLSIQINTLFQTLETHLLCNHLFANAKALLFAGLYFQGTVADKWLRKSIQILKQEIKEQIHPDGGHIELSPMYHAVVLSDMLDILSIVDTYKLEVCLDLELTIRDRLPSMLTWLADLSHPDGEIALFNDSAIGIYPTEKQLRIAAEGFNISPLINSDSSLAVYPNSGYFNLRYLSAVLIGDVGNIGPDYNPGHAHADTLSFELSIFGSRFLVNSGTSTYENNELRYYQRGTKAHNTVCLDNLNSSEVWGAFRVARRAKPKDLVIDKKNMSICCSHDGYMRLKKKQVHKRSWTTKKNSITIKDEIKGTFKSAEVRFHVHPDWVFNKTKNILTFKNKMKIIQIEILKGKHLIEQTYYYPSFGVKLKNSVLRIMPIDNTTMVKIYW
ncbi:heparinase II/III family protein [Amylibacter sp.]|nr:heparinase II/III family protein [Amylibacter sp.]